MAHLAERVALLETRQDMEERLNAARDSDLSNLVVKVDSHTCMLQALQERQAEQSLILGSLDHKVDSLDHKVDSLDQKVDSLDHKVESLDHKVDSLDHRVESLDHKVESLDHRVESLDHKVESLDHRVESLDHKVESLDHKVESLRQMTTDGFAAIGGQLQLIIARVDGEDRH